MSSTSFELEITDQHWLGEPREQVRDGCSHGRIRAVIGGVRVTSDEAEYGISQSALSLLRTLERDHTPQDPVSDYFLLCHGCGYPTHFGCANFGTDWVVRHDGDTVFLSQPSHYSALTAKPSSTCRPACRSSTTAARSSPSHRPPTTSISAERLANSRTGSRSSTMRSGPSSMSASPGRGSRPPVGRLATVVKEPESSDPRPPWLALRCAMTTRVIERGYRLVVSEYLFDTGGRLPPGRAGYADRLGRAGRSAGRTPASSRRRGTIRSTSATT